MVTQFHTFSHFSALSHTATTHTDLYTHSHTHILYSKSHFWPEIHWFLYSKSFPVYDVQRGLHIVWVLFLFPKLSPYHDQYGYGYD